MVTTPSDGRGRLGDDSSTRAPEIAAALQRGFAASWIGDVDEAARTVLADIAAVLATTWSTTPPELAGFAAELARCLPAQAADGDLAGALAKLHATDLHLAFAARRGDASAIARFEREYLATVRGAIARVDASESFVDEIRQRVRTKLLVADADGPAKLAHYTGQGELQTWLRVVAAREALSAVRRSGKEAPNDDGLLAMEASATGPELGALRAEYRTQFASAFTEALGRLEPAQRNLLRLHYLHGLSIDELGGLLHVHRSSAARRIVKARESLLADTRRAMLVRLAIGPTEFEQLMSVVLSRLDLSIERFLAADGDPGPRDQPGTQ